MFDLGPRPCLSSIKYPDRSYPVATGQCFLPVAFALFFQKTLLASTARALVWTKKVTFQLFQGSARTGGVRQVHLSIIQTNTGGWVIANKQGAVHINIVQ